MLRKANEALESKSTKRDLQRYKKIDTRAYIAAISIKYRHRLNLSQEQMARKFNVPVKKIQEIEENL